MADYDWLNRRVAIGGAINTLYDARKIAADGITRVLNLRTSQDEVEFVQKVGMEYVSNPTSDDSKGDPDEVSKPPTWFATSYGIIISALEQPGGRILIHCQEGLNRAPSTAYFWLRALGWSKDDAAKCVAEARPKAKKYMRWNDDADAAIKALGY